MVPCGVFFRDINHGYSASFTIHQARFRAASRNQGSFVFFSGTGQSPGRGQTGAETGNGTGRPGAVVWRSRSPENGTGLAEKEVWTEPADVRLTWIAGTDDLPLTQQCALAKNNPDPQLRKSQKKSNKKQASIRVSLENALAGMKPFHCPSHRIRNHLDLILGLTQGFEALAECHQLVNNHTKLNGIDGF